MKTFLLVIDAQTGFYVEGVNSETLERVNRIVASGLFDCIIASVYQNYENSEIIRFMGWDKLQTPTEQSLLAPIESHANHIVYKTTYSAYSEPLRELLIKENGGIVPECVFLVGVDTNCCVLTTATDLFEAGIRPIVLADYCGSSSGRTAHEAGLKVLASLIGTNNIWNGIVCTKQQLYQALVQAEKMVYQRKTPFEQKVQRLINLLATRKWKITFAESCTGGIISSALVGVSSASSVFDSSFVTYSNESKIKYLGVSPMSIASYGVVSEVVVKEMAVGVADMNGAQIGIAVSGISGPTGGTLRKPIGMVCFGFWINGDCFASTQYFGDLGRNMVRKKSMEFVYDTLLQYLENSVNLAGTV